MSTVLVNGHKSYSDYADTQAESVSAHGYVHWSANVTGRQERRIRVHMRHDAWQNVVNSEGMMIVDRIQKIVRGVGCWVAEM